MDKQIIDKISKQVYRKFPEMQGSKPSVEKNYGPQPKSPGGTSKHLLVYSTVAKRPNGSSIPRRVRVVADNKGKIIRISTSR